MSARTKKVNPLDRLVTKRDLFKVIAAMNQATRNLESRIEDLEKARELDAEDVGGIPSITDEGFEATRRPFIEVVR